MDEYGNAIYLTPRSRAIASVSPRLGAFCDLAARATDPCSHALYALTRRNKKTPDETKPMPPSRTSLKSFSKSQYGEGRQTAMDAADIVAVKGPAIGSKTDLSSRPP